MLIKINLFKRTFILETIIRRQRNKQMMNGYTNRCKDGKYIVFLDYDHMELDWIIPEIESLQVFFHLDNFYVFQSSENSFHAVCFDKVTLPEVVKILKNTSVDPNYVNVPLYFGKKIWTLRLTDKDNTNIKYVHTVKPGRDGWRDQSRPHIDLINNLFEDVRVVSHKSDNQTELILSRYPI